jgi:hypothetical protein
MAERKSFARRAARRRPPAAKDGDEGRPEVIVDFVFDDGLLFISVENIGDKPALKVSVQFDQKIMGVEGGQEISALPLFRSIEFLAPHKAIVTFLDTSAAYFRRGEPTRIAATITYQDSNRARYKTTLHHDLEIYKDIGYIRRLADRAISGG